MLPEEVEEIRVMTIVRKLRIKLLPEQAEQVKLFCWIRSRPDLEPYAMHLANERKTSFITGTLLKIMGVRAGASDVMLPIARHGHHGLFLELKARKGRMTPNQRKFLADMTTQGYLAVCCTGYDSARAFIEAYMGDGNLSNICTNRVA